ncbi:MAG: alpha/beta fold hydrolase, partial [Alphaproteobacteria bacterium]|nr:alpha/beta fold hydrolase [Alphaproteobacteria bacterium]
MASAPTGKSSADRTRLSSGASASAPASKARRIASIDGGPSPGRRFLLRPTLPCCANDEAPAPFVSGTKGMIRVRHETGGAMKVTRHFVRVGEREVHYRRAGNGPPFVLFHVSPQSSAFVIPGMLPLADSHTLIALDTPGYGESDALPNSAPTMVDYADAALETLGALGLGKVPIFGSHTGANIAVELARRAPDRVAALVLDGLSLNSPEVSHDRIASYAPTFQPSADGAHLAWAWQHTRDQLIFWPWYEPHRPNRLKQGIKGPDFVHDVVLAKMAATRYWLGYRAAFGHDYRDALYNCPAPIYFVTPNADVHTAVERSLKGLPAHMYFIDTDHDGQVDAIAGALAKVKGDPSVGPAAKPGHRRRLYRDFVTVGDGQRLVRRGGVESGKPLVLLHGAMGTSAALVDRATALAAKRPVLAIDIAGNGDSDPLPKKDADLAAYAEDVRAAIKAAGVDGYDLYGEGLGAILALEVARQGNAGKVILDRPERPDAATRKDMIANVAPIIDARFDGGHFLTAWHMLRDAALFYPWYRTTADAVRDIEPDVEPAMLQARLLPWLKGRLTYGDYVRAALRADPDKLIAATRQPCLVFGTAGDLIADHARRVASALTQSTLLETERVAPPTTAMTQFL